MTSLIGHFTFDKEYIKLLIINSMIKLEEISPWEVSIDGYLPPQRKSLNYLKASA